MLTFYDLVFNTYVLQKVLQIYFLNIYLKNLISVGGVMKFLNLKIKHSYRELKYVSYVLQDLFYLRKKVDGLFSVGSQVKLFIYQEVRKTIPFYKVLISCTVRKLRRVTSYIRTLYIITKAIHTTTVLAFWWKSTKIEYHVQRLSVASKGIEFNIQIRYETIK